MPTRVLKGLHNSVGSLVGKYMEVLVVIAFILFILWLLTQRSKKNTGSDSRISHPAPHPQSKSPSSSTLYAPSHAADAITSDSCWVQPGTAFAAAGVSIPGGMIYVGRGLGSIAGWHSVEPALIDPSLRVDRSRPNRTGTGMPYWPSYSEISPQCRAAYLEWLAGGRRDPSAYIGYVFLFFYGLERRALTDARGSEIAQQELSAMIVEVEALQVVYGGNSSFGIYASQFLDIVTLIQGHHEAQPPLERVGWELPMSLRIGIGNIVDAGKPLPVDWALSWYLTHPDTTLRTPSRRCSSEFRELFQIRYAEEFGEGLVIKPNQSKLKVEVRPASPSFGGPVVLSVDLPDIAKLSAPVAKIRSIAEACCADLDSYSRWIGRNPEQPKNLAAVALLPRELAASYPSAEANALWDWIGDHMGLLDRAVIRSAELLSHWPNASTGKLSKSDAVLFAQLLEKRGFGIEPDVRFGGAALAHSNSAVLFNLPPDAPAIASPQYAAATVLLHLAVAVSAADGTISAKEKQHLEEHLEQVLVLSAPERVRLSAHLAWLLTAEPGMAGLRKKLETLSEEHRNAIGDFIVGVAGADGQITPDEIRILERVYPMLGLAPNDVYSHMHAMTAVGSADIFDSAEPVTVIPAQSVEGFAIPARPPRRQIVQLDMATVEAKLAQSATISAILNDIFTEDEMDPDVSISLTPENGKLGKRYATLLHRLTERSAWSRSEFDSLAAELELLPDGAIDTLNERSLDHLGISVIEGDDPITVDLDAAKEMLA